MKIAVLDTYYPAFLAQLYRSEPGLDRLSYPLQLSRLIDACFGTADFYSRHLNALGCEAIDLVANCVPLQKTWADAHGLRTIEALLRVPTRLLRLPMAGSILAQLPGMSDVILAQMRAFQPDVLYCQDMNFLAPRVLRALKPHAKLIVGQIASPLPPKPFLLGYDLVLTSFPHFVDRLRGLGLRAEYFRIGFDTRVLERLGPIEQDLGSSFVGGISRHHLRAVPLLEVLAQRTPTVFYGYGVDALPASSPIRARHCGEVWGMDMYRALARSRVTLNRHIGVAENFANNMRLYEATGVGAMLITDHKDNLGSLFDVGREVVAYRSIDEAVELVEHYAAHPEQARAIARAGQARTLAEHTYAHRMQELVPMLRQHLE